MLEDWGNIKHPQLAAQKMLAGFADLPVVDCGPIGGGRGKLRAIFGMTTTESSFKTILGFGMLLLAYEAGLLRPGQTVCESSSGSLATGLALAGKVLGNPVEIVSDPNIPVVTRRRVELLRVPAHGPAARRREPGARHRRPAGRAADHRGAVRVSVPEKLLGASALIMALCCALLPLAGAAVGGGLIASAGTVGLVAGIAVLAAVVYAVTRRRKAGRRC